MYKLLLEARHARRVRRARGRRRTPSAGSANRVAAARSRRSSRPARGCWRERAGTDVKRLRNDVDRLLLYALGQKTITVDDVREIVGPAALQDDWAMTNAIEAGDGATALRQLALMLEAGAPPEKILGQLGWLVRTKFPVHRAGALRPAIDALFRTDLDLKRSAGDPRVLLERLVVELCAWKRGDRGAGRPLLTFAAARRVVQPRLVAAGGVAVNDRPCSPSCRSARSSASARSWRPRRSLPSIAARMLLSAPRRRERNWRLCSRFLRLCRCALSADAC